MLPHSLPIGSVAETVRSAGAALSPLLRSILACSNSCPPTSSFPAKPAGGKSIIGSEREGCEGGVSAQKLYFAHGIHMHQQWLSNGAQQQTYLHVRTADELQINASTHLMLHRAMHTSSSQQQQPAATAGPSSNASSNGPSHGPGSSSSSNSTDSGPKQSSPGPNTGSGSGDLRQALLEASLKHVKALGWSHAALVAGARAMGLSPAVVGVLPRGEAQLVEHFIGGCNAKLADLLVEPQTQELLSSMPGTPERLHWALRTRLEMLGPLIDTWPQAMALLSRPQHLSHAMALLGAMVDDIWHLAGRDTATDMTWYSKRASLATVYIATELYMVTDYSPGFEDTWQSLTRRLADLEAIDKATGEADLAGASSAVMSAVASVLQQQQQRRAQDMAATAASAANAAASAMGVQGGAGGGPPGK